MKKTKKILSFRPQVSNSSSSVGSETGDDVVGIVTQFRPVAGDVDAWSPHVRASQVSLNVKDVTTQEVVSHPFS